MDLGGVCGSPPPSDSLPEGDVLLPASLSKSDQPALAARLRWWGDVDLQGLPPPTASLLGQGGSDPAYFSFSISPSPPTSLPDGNLLVGSPCGMAEAQISSWGSLHPRQGHTTSSINGGRADRSQLPLPGPGAASSHPLHPAQEQGRPENLLATLNGQLGATLMGAEKVPPPSSNRKGETRLPSHTAVESGQLPLSVLVNGMEEGYTDLHSNGPMFMKWHLLSRQNL